jgi:hypothetical protein
VCVLKSAPDRGFLQVANAVFCAVFFRKCCILQQVLYFCAVVSVVKCRTNSSKIPLRGSLEKDETNESLKISLSVVFIAQRLARLAGTMGSAPEEPSSSVATGGSDETGVSGKGTSGTCHVCGGALRRGNVSLARQCVTCKTRYHASDCGKRRSNAGYGKPYDVCPKVRRAFRLARPAPRVERDRIRSSRTDSARARGTRAPLPRMSNTTTTPH